MSLSARLSGLPRPIRLGIIGAGAMGRGLAYQATVTPGMACVALADLEVSRTLGCEDAVGTSCQVVASASETQDAIARGRVACCEDGALVATCDQVDVLVEASSGIVGSAPYVLAALARGKPVVLMNAEVDLAFGPLFRSLARRHGTVCTSSDGDQHGVLKRLIDEMRLWGFELVMAGNIKGFLDRRADPTSIIPEADKRGLDYRMCAAYTDGTKLCIEMALLANALGLRTDTPGMHGPRAQHVTQAPELFDLAGIWERTGGAVDYVLGAEPGGGVFAVGHCDHPYQRKMMDYYKMGPGPFYVFYRACHLCHVEAMRTIAEAFLDREALLEPDRGFVTNVYAYAKRGLRAGDELDGVGGYACYGMIENCGSGGTHAGLPICLAEGLRLVSDVPLDAPILLENVAVPPGHPGLDLQRQAQEAAGEP